MQNLVIAPTATYKRSGTRLTVDDIIKDSPDAVRINQVLNKPGFYPTIPAGGAVKNSRGVGTKQYFDMRQVHSLNNYNRTKALQVFDLDYLYDVRPMYNISLPDMKLRKKDLGQI
jgi:hypothetical protein